MVTKPWMTARCRSCGKEYGWNGDYLDMPACPGCGYFLPEDKKKELQEKHEAIFGKNKKKTTPKPKKEQGEQKSKKGKKELKRRNKKRRK